MLQPDVTQFFLECEKISSKAQFFIDSIPNANVASAKCLIHQLLAIWTILHNLDDLFTSVEATEELITYVNTLLHLLEHFVENPPPAPAVFVNQEYTGASQVGHIIRLTYSMRFCCIILIIPGEM